MNEASPKKPPATISRYSSGRKMRFESTRASPPSVRSRVASGSALAAAEARHPALEVGQLVLRFARQQVDQAALHALALEEGVVHLLGDRHLDAVSRRESEGRVDRVGALGDAGQR